MSDLVLVLLPVLGAVLTAHCLRMAWQELRTGAGSTKIVDYPRSAQLTAFLVIIFVNALGAVLGLFFLMIGLIGLLAVVKQ